MNDILRELIGNPVSPLPEPSERERLRKLFGVSQTTLANKLGVSRRTVHAWEHGTGEPSGKNRELYAEVLALWAEREKQPKSNS